jgi:3-hydroxyacyl-CoA dehydrogenase
LSLIRSSARELGIPQREFADREILDRSLYGLINEGAKILDEGYAQRAADIDTIYINGYGFPSWRGGPMFYASTVGIRAIYDRICEFEKHLGARWKPADLLRRLAAEDMSFQEYDAERSA